ncbi:MAG: AsnC family transcriptional regulator [Euryarchaeota archaeon]|nr:AsnC family transcriptional regulator [Euryarchaeota archaeon]DAC36638.1 MAG TPA: Lrp/AsnC family transcriptional regulator [Candidatus Poseidoniales archaeon]HIH56641.1 Lrp/AsnC family transcriptional regulator [Candidatus Thalassarchaeum sp.]|tara:strand:- start:427 stop:918 length:492 start_codon:yes stop_codon:yes gene_type:complete
MFNSLLLECSSPGGIMLDDTDRRIISVLQSDARASMRSIAEQAGVSLGTVSNRVRRLEKAGVIRGYSVQLDPELSGWELTVVIGLRIEKGRLIEIQEKIAKDNRVYGAYDVTGEFDSMIIARARDRRDLDDLSKNVISIDGVESSVTHLVLNTVKESSTVLPE